MTSWSHARALFSLIAGASLALWVASTSFAQGLRVDGMNIIEAGIYEAVIEKKVPDPRDPTGFHNVLGDPKLIQKTSTVPARQGTRFGTRAMIVGAPNNASVPIRIVYRPPAAGLRNPKTGEIIYRGEYTDNWKIGATVYTEYYLENEWEVVPGDWTFEYWYGNRKLAEHKFTLTKP